jgi:hypothetical protein
MLKGFLGVKEWFGAVDVLFGSFSYERRDDEGARSGY